MMNKIKKTGSDRVFDTVNLVLCSILFVLVAYPLIYVVSASFSDPFAVLQGQMKLIPVGFTLNSYAKILEH